MYAKDQQHNTPEELLDAIKGRVRSIGQEVITLDGLDVRRRDRDMSRPFGYLRLCNIYVDDGGVLRGDLMGEPHAEAITQFGMDIEGLGIEDLKRLLSRLHTGKFTAIDDTTAVLPVKDAGAARHFDAGNRGLFRRAQSFMHPLRKGA